jgi:hypothetical protein
VREVCCTVRFGCCVAHVLNARGRTRGSPVLWRVFVEFEIRAGDLRRAKEVLFRAVGQCPLVKGTHCVCVMLEGGTRC